MIPVVAIALMYKCERNCLWFGSTLFSIYPHMENRISNSLAFIYDLVTVQVRVKEALGVLGRLESDKMNYVMV